MSESTVDPIVRLQKQSAVNKSWSNTKDWAARTEPARQAYNDRWDNLVDPDGELDPATRSKLADKAKTAHYQMMAAKSAQVRRAKSKARASKSKARATEPTPRARKGGQE